MISIISTAEKPKIFPCRLKISINSTNDKSMTYIRGTIINNEIEFKKFYDLQMLKHVKYNNDGDINKLFDKLLEGVILKNEKLLKIADYLSILYNKIKITLSDEENLLSGNNVIFFVIEWTSDTNWDQVLLNESKNYNETKCFNCKKILTIAEAKTCGKCKQTTYCSPECQKNDWKFHKKKCSNSELYYAKDGY